MSSFAKQFPMLPEDSDEWESGGEYQCPEEDCGARVTVTKSGKVVGHMSSGSAGRYSDCPLREEHLSGNND